MNAPATKDFEETAEAITLHGLGFLQIKLQGRQRLHVWHPALPRRSCFEHSSIHNHRFGFISRVLVGTQINLDFRIWAQPIEPPVVPTHVRYLHEGARTAFGNRPWLPDGEVTVVFAGRRVIPPGKDYEMVPLDFHATVPAGDGKVATLMQKFPDEATIGAHSLCAIGVTPDADFDRKQWPPERLWTIAREVLGG